MHFINLYANPNFYATGVFVFELSSYCTSIPKVPYWYHTVPIKTKITFSKFVRYEFGPFLLRLAVCMIDILYNQVIINK